MKKRLLAPTALALLLSFTVPMLAQLDQVTGANEASNQTDLPFQITSTNQVSISAITGDTFAYLDFANGLDDWTFVQTNPDTVLLWEYETNPDLSADNNDTRFAPFNSPSVANGFLWFDYRKYLIDIDYVIGSPPYPQLTQSAISPTLDLSQLDPDGAYAVNFYSYQPTLNIRNHNVSIRYTDGSSQTVIWTALDEIARPNVATPGVQVAVIPREFYGASNVELVFQHDGDFYGWAIDDILITQRPLNDGALTNFYSRAANAATPSTEASAYPLAFVADVLNNGGGDQAMRLVIDIADTSNQLLYTDTLDYPTIMADSLFENNVFEESFPMPTETGSYVGTYTLLTTLADDENNPNNNTVSFNFEVTENYYSKSGNIDDGGVRPSANNEEYGSMNFYLTPSLVNGDSVYIDSMSFRAVPRDFTGLDEGFLEFSLLGWRGDLNGDGIPTLGDDIDDPDLELVQLTFTDHIVTADWGDTLITTSPSEDGRVLLPTDEGFIGFAVALDYFPSTGGTNDDNRFFTGQVGFSNSAYTLATDSLGAPIYQHALRRPDNANPLIYGYFTDRTPFLDAYITVKDGVSSTTVLPEEAFSIWPNPANDHLVLSFDLEAEVESYRIHNAVGQLITSNVINQSGPSTMTIDTKNLRPGLYYIEVVTENNARAVRKFLKAK